MPLTDTTVPLLGSGHGGSEETFRMVAEAEKLEFPGEKKLKLV